MLELVFTLILLSPFFTLALLASSNYGKEGTFLAILSGQAGVIFALGWGVRLTIWLAVQGDMNRTTFFSGLMGKWLELMFGDFWANFTYVLWLVFLGIMFHRMKKQRVRRVI